MVVCCFYFISLDESHLQTGLPLCYLRTKIKQRAYKESLCSRNWSNTKNLNELDIFINRPYKSPWYTIFCPGDSVLPSICLSLEQEDWGKHFYTWIIHNLQSRVSFMSTLQLTIHVICITGVTPTITFIGKQNVDKYMWYQMAIKKSTTTKQENDFLGGISNKHLYVRHSIIDLCPMNKRTRLETIRECRRQQKLKQSKTTSCRHKWWQRCHHFQSENPLSLDLTK